MTKPLALAVLAAFVAILIGWGELARRCTAPISLPAPSVRSPLFLLPLTGDGCLHTVSSHAEPVRSWHRCDAEFDGCFRGCGASLARSYPGDVAGQDRWTASAVACVEECDRRIPVAAGQVLLNGVGPPAWGPPPE